MIAPKGIYIVQGPKGGTCILSYTRPRDTLSFFVPCRPKDAFDALRPYKPTSSLREWYDISIFDARHLIKPLRVSAGVEFAAVVCIAFVYACFMEVASSNMGFTTPPTWLDF